MTAGSTEASIRRSNDRRVKRTKRAIHEAVQKLLAEVPYEKLTIAAIAREADIDRKTFYLHYHSIDDVLDEAIREDVDVLVSTWREGLGKRSEEETMYDLVERTCISLAKELKEKRGMLKNLSSDVLLRKIEGPFIEASIQEDVFGAASAMGSKLPYGVSYLCSGLLGILQRWLYEDNTLSVEEFAALASTLIVEGMRGVVNVSVPASV